MVKTCFLNKELNKNQLKIEDFDEKTVRTVVDLCYGQKGFGYYCEKDKQEDYLFTVIKFTTVYDMPEIKQQVECKVVERITVKTVCGLANKSVEFKADKLRGYCVNFIANCIKEKEHCDGYENVHKEIGYEVFKAIMCHKSES